jgi:hypothetical protein
MGDLMQIYGYSEFVFVLLAAFAFVGIRLIADYVSGSRHYVIDFEKKPETDGGNKISPNELMKVIETAQDASDTKRATKGLPVLFDELNFNQENSKLVLATDEIDYGLNRLSEAGKIIRYKNLIASAKQGEESIVAYYIYELAMKEDAHAIDKDYKKMLKANNMISLDGMAQWRQEAHSANDSDISIVTLGVEQANLLRKNTYSYDSNGGYLLFLLSNGMLRCINA